MKRLAGLIVFAICTIFSACAEVDECKAVDISGWQANEFEYQRTDELAANNKISEYSINYPESSYSGTFCVYEDVLYYALAFEEYYIDQTGEREEIPYNEDYCTQVRAYNISTGEDSLLFRYEGEKYVRITDMQCNGSILIWEDYLSGWSIQGISLDTNVIMKDVGLSKICYTITNKII